jgi:hypothetical protein
VFDRVIQTCGDSPTVSTLVFDRVIQTCGDSPTVITLVFDRAIQTSSGSAYGHHALNQETPRK